ncbi:unnamed protein product [Cochlearia groenlandica]
MQVVKQTKHETRKKGNPDTLFKHKNLTRTEVRDRKTQPLVQSLALIPRDTPLVRISTLWQRQALFFGGLMAEVKVMMIKCQKPADMEVNEYEMVVDVSSNLWVDGLMVCRCS